MAEPYRALFADLEGAWREGWRPRRGRRIRGAARVGATEVPTPGRLTAEQGSSQRKEQRGSLSSRICIQDAVRPNTT